MFRFTIRDVLWLTAVVVIGLTLLAIAQSGSQATMEGNAFSVVNCLAMLVAVFRIAGAHRPVGKWAACNAAFCDSRTGGADSGGGY